MRVAVMLDSNESGEVAGPEHHIDLRGDPKAIERIECARRYPPLGNFLTNLNASESHFSTIGCGAWSETEEETPEPNIFASRVDLVFLREAANFGYSPLTDLAERLAELLEREPAQALLAELHLLPAQFAGERRGFCLRVSLYAKGATPEQASIRWGFGLLRLQQALLFLGRALRQQAGRCN